MHPLTKQVFASRKAHGLTLERATDYHHFSETLPPATRALGLASHATPFSILVDAGNVLAKPEPSLRPLLMLSFLDGYALASHLDREPRGKGKALASPAACKRFLTTAATSGPALLSGPHEEVALELIESLAPSPEDGARQLMANALACGVLLYQYEQERVVPGFEGLSLAKRKPRPTATDVTAEPPRALLDGVLAAPHDDAPRLVLADWLSEHGDPLGEFIQVQCALGRGRFGAGGKWILPGRTKLPFDTKEALTAREQELLSLYEKRWVAPIRPAIRQWGFRRGFVDHVIADLSKFAAAVPALSRTPLERAKLTGFKRDQVRALATAPAHPTLESIDLGANRLDDRAAPLLGSPLVSKLTGLDLQMNPLGGECLAALAGHQALRRLRFSNGEFTDDDFAQLARAPFWRSLTGLDLSRCAALTSRAAEVVNAAPNLEWLSFNLPDASDDAVLSVARAHPKLTHFSFVVTKVKDSTVLEVLRALPGLRYLQPPSGVSSSVQAAIARRLPEQTYTTLLP